MAFDAADAEDELLAKALYVGGSEDADDTVEKGKLPATAEEYLRNVIREAKSIQSVVSAKNAAQLSILNPRNSTHVSREKSSVRDESLLPSKEWQDRQVHDFSQVRTRLSRHVALIQSGEVENPPGKQTLPKKSNERGWCCYCFGKQFWERVQEARGRNQVDGTEENGEKTGRSKAFHDLEAGTDPSVSVVCQLKPSEVVRLLEQQIDWAEQLEEVSQQQGLWVYSLLARVEKPLHPDVTSTLRSLLLVCSKQRSKEAEEKKMTPAHLNLIICLIGKYFDQRDLADSPH